MWRHGSSYNAGIDFIVQKNVLPFTYITFYMYRFVHRTAGDVCLQPTLPPKPKCRANIMKKSTILGPLQAKIISSHRANTGIPASSLIGSRNTWVKNPLPGLGRITSLSCWSTSHSIQNSFHLSNHYT